MKNTVTVKPGASSILKEHWFALQAAEKDIHPPDPVVNPDTEVEQVAARCGESVTRLDGPWTDLVQKFSSLGTVMSLTQNESIVHKKVGRFDNVAISENMGMVVNEAIDFRIFFDHWHSGFAVVEKTPGGIRKSLQFYDAAGTAVHKVYLSGESDDSAFDALAEKFTNADQSSAQPVHPKTKPPEDRSDAKIDRVLLRERWDALQNVHDFYPMLQDLGVGRLQAFRLAGDDVARRVTNASFRTMLESAAAAEMSIMIFAGNSGAIQIHTGLVHNLEEAGAWFSVLDPGFHLHSRQDRIDSSWVIRKPTRDGVVTSLEIYGSDKQQLAWMFSQRNPGKSEREEWRELLDALESDGVSTP